MAKDILIITLVSFISFTFLDWQNPGLISDFMHPAVLLALLIVVLVFATCARHKD